MKALKDEKAKAVKEIGKHKSEVEGLAKRIVADEGGNAPNPSGEIERLEKDVEKLMAEKEFMEHAVKNT
ncbi:MAG: hypothetical protein QXK32_08885 [Candidatus Jordarchaeales archaeon]